MVKKRPKLRLQRHLGSWSSSIVQFTCAFVCLDLPMTPSPFCPSKAAASQSKRPEPNIKELAQCLRIHFCTPLISIMSFFLKFAESSSGSSSSSSSDEEEHVVVLLHFSRKFLVQTLQIQQDKDGQKEAKAETAKAFGKLKQFNCSIHLCICLSRSPDDTQSFLPFQGCCKPIQKAWAKDQGASTMLTNPSVLL